MKSSKGEKSSNGETGKKNSTGNTRGKKSGSGEKFRFLFGIILTGTATYLLIAFIAFLFWWKTDLSLATDQVISGPELQVKNWSGKLGVWLSEFFITNGFGLGAFFIPLIIAAAGLKLLNFPSLRFWKLLLKFTFATILLSLLAGYVFGMAGGFLGSGPGGAQGYFVVKWLNSFIGKPGTGILLIVLTLLFLVFILNIHPETLSKILQSLFTKFLKKQQPAGEIKSDTDNEKDLKNEAET
ncbi:MAG TPA: DNA translocase FtsK 4TM domain-containing protein, partial [Bacteroidales bacterium]|nr:DNA translocase FtsK 4TM domain-containing protein [Bacteroidales bacterium]HRU57181.1 DNA translocase FtsK 4TM domain-containing protein [Bacteroidales bacterium]